MPRLYVLGGGGWIPTPRRSTNSFLIETRRCLIFLDAGVGLCRLSDPMMQAVLRRVPRALVLLSHYHHDHIEGLHYLPHFLRDHDVTLAAPPASVTGVTANEILGRYSGAPLLPHPIVTWPGRFPNGFKLVELSVGRNRVAGETVEVIGQPHSDPTIGFRVRDVCYVSDTTCRPETATFASKAAVLVHDAWLDSEDEASGHEDLRIHGTANGAAQIARDAQVKDLILGHLNPRYDEARLERMLVEAARVFSRTHLANDFQVWEIQSADAEEEAPKAAVAPAAADDAET